MVLHICVEKAASGRCRAESLENRGWDVMIEIFAGVTERNDEDALFLVIGDPVDHGGTQTLGTHDVLARESRGGSGPCSVAHFSVGQEICRYARSGCLNLGGIGGLWPYGGRTQRSEIAAYG